MKLGLIQLYMFYGISIQWHKGTVQRVHYDSKNGQGSNLTAEISHMDFKWELVVMKTANHN